MRKFSITSDIAVPADGYGTMSDTDRWDEWTPSVISVKRLARAVRRRSRAVIRQPRFHGVVKNHRDRAGQELHLD